MTVIPGISRPGGFPRGFHVIQLHCPALPRSIIFNPVSFPVTRAFPRPEVHYCIYPALRGKRNRLTRAQPHKAILNKYLSVCYLGTLLADFTHEITRAWYLPPDFRANRHWLPLKIGAFPGVAPPK